MAPHETVLILPPSLAPAGAGPLATLADTPYGVAPGLHADGLPVLVRAEGTDARALIYAAKAMGARRVLAGDVVDGLSPLLEPGDLVVPADVIDQTRLRPFTFFVGKGYGFIKLNPPFCPDLMTTLLAVARERQPRAFRGATYVCTEGPRDATPAERKMFRQWGADVAGSALLPETYLARELELCYAALTVVGAGDGGDLFGLLRQAAGAGAAAGRAPGATGPACACDQTMAFMKAQGVVGEDWRTW